ncbi:hypothetical protein J4526_04430 [Desulfurococcaceae archaeon MEX13E-LK6-19]|nr:hypothetical protein J4526_04430 [Desulfurococcaceae archaeon MEX13E-LK6-19]
MSEEVKYVVKVGEKEIEINEETLKIIRQYLHTPMSLEELAEKLGLDSWDEAYEFIKKVPAWIIWTPPSLWKYRIKWIKEKEASQEA